MELFFGEISAATARLGQEDALHCVKVLRHKVGDIINVFDGQGLMCECTILSANAKSVEAKVEKSFENWNALPYSLTIGICPTKNNDRFENFIDKAVEMGIDKICPLIGEHSERKVYKIERADRVAMSAVKQSLKARIPEICEPASVKDFVLQERDGLKLIAYCFEDESVPRTSLCSALNSFNGNKITILIGPEGDFSEEEAKLAIRNGYIPVHLGNSRLRTETAGIFSVAAVYNKFSV